MGENESPYIADPWVGKALNFSVTILVVALLGALVFTWPNSQRLNAERSESDRIEAIVDSVSPCSSKLTECTVIDIVPSEGPDVGQIFRLPELRGIEVAVFSGDRIMVEVDVEATPINRYRFSDQVRLPWLGVLSALFAVATIVAARVHGLRALLGLIASVLILGAYTLPSIYEGTSPLLVGAITSGLLATSIVLALGGRSTETKVALVASIISIGSAGVIGEVAFSAARFNGGGTASLFALNDTVNIRGLLLAGLMIGCTGLVVASTSRQARLVASIRSDFPHWTNRQIYARAASSGRADLGASLSTLFLAYAGASLPLLVLFVASDLPPELAANSEVIAIEVVRPLVGSIGLLLATPIATIISVGLLSQSTSTIDLTSESPDLGVAKRPIRTQSDKSLWAKLREGLDD